MSTAAAAVTRRTHGWSVVWGVLLILFGLLAVALPWPVRSALFS
jgi:uncharacterized membrane protein HdeD (DUF308 family)